MLADGLIDVCPSSSFEYACHSEQYLILPQLSISSFQAVGSVLLFSQVPIEELGGNTVLLSSESATSVNLLRIILANRYGCKCTYELHTSSFDEGFSGYSALLLIGDAALRASLQKFAPYVYDLGQLWADWTGLPFVFALWLCRRNVAENQKDEMTGLIWKLMDSKEYARNNLHSIAERSSDAAWMGCERLVAYWQENISYELNDKHLDGLRLFYRYCVELGLLPSEPELEFFQLPHRKEM
jgi:chorismate dehydratase